MTDDDSGEDGFDDLPLEMRSSEESLPIVSGAARPEHSKTDDRANRRRSRRMMIATALAALFVVSAGTAAWRLLGSEGNAPEEGADEATEVGPNSILAATPTEPVDNIEGSPSTSSGSGTTAPVGPSLAVAPDLPTLGLFDSFSRADSGDLGFTQSGREWIEVTGAWSIESQSAMVSEPSTAGPSIAVSNTRTTRSIVQVTMSSVERAAGLVFRYTNPFNYWEMVAAPGSGTWTISQVSLGESIFVDTVGLATVDDNTTIAVRTDERSMDFFVDGTLVKSIATSDPMGGTYAGLIGRGAGAVDARWINFVVVALAGPG